MTQNIKFKGFDLEVAFNYYKGSKGDYYTPDDSDEIEITEVIYNGIDIWELLIELNQADTIEHLIIEKL